jgi:hypothetical protein
MQSSNNSLKVGLGVPSRGHFVEQFIFLAVIQTPLAAARTNVYLAVDWQWMSIFLLGTCLSRDSQQLTFPAGRHVNVSKIRYLGIDISLCRGVTCHSILNDKSFCFQVLHVKTREKN